MSNNCQTVAEQVYHIKYYLVNDKQCQTSCQTVSDSCRNWYIIISCNLIYIVKQCQTVSDSCRTMLIQQYYSVNDIQC